MLKLLKHLFATPFVLFCTFFFSCAFHFTNMEFSISPSSLRLSATIPQGYKAPSNFNRPIPITPIKFSNFPSKCATNKMINLPVGLYGENRFSKSFFFGRHKQNSNRACAQVESDGSNPLLAKAQVDIAGPDSLVAKVLRFVSTCYKFTLPYSMIQVLVTVIFLFARVVVENPQLFKWSLLFKAFPALIAVFFAQTYNFGLNQYFDADIDRVNKPYLPIPSGDLSIKQARLLLTFVVLGGLSILRLMNADLITTSLYCLGLLLATFYSAPPFRFKRSSTATATVIPLTSLVQTIGVLYAARASLGLPFLWSPPTAFIAIFPTIFFAVICIIKDIPDVEGDLKHNIRTFAARFGPKNVASCGIGMLLANYIGAITAAIFMPQAFKRYIMLPAHAILALMLLFQARKLDKANYDQDASTNFYRFLWQLLSLEYLLFPFI